MYNLVIHVTSSLASMLLVFTLAGVVLCFQCVCDVKRDVSFRQKSQTCLQEVGMGSIGHF